MNCVILLHKADRAIFAVCYKKTGVECTIEQTLNTRDMLSTPSLSAKTEKGACCSKECALVITGSVPSGQAITGWRID